MKTKVGLLLVAVAVVLVPSRFAASAAGSLEVTSAERTIDLVSQLVKINTQMTLANGGSNTATSFLVLLEEMFRDKVAFISVTGGKSDKSFKVVSGLKLEEGAPGFVAYRVELGNSGIPVGKSVTYNVEVVMAQALEMLPEMIAQKEKQLVVFKGSHHIPLAYPCKTQTTKVLLPSTAVESYSKLKPVSLNDKKLTYGPYADVAAFSDTSSSEPMVVHYTNNNPFLIVSQMERTIELSMWGNIAVEETFDMRHDGAKLKGPFSRYEFQRESAGASAIQSFRTYLPASARDVYYRDDIGNVSTSALRVLEGSVELELRPRFPLFGGWKTHYFIGYNVPSYEYLFSDKDDLFVLSMRLLDHVYDDMLVEDFTLRVILPEGSKVKEFRSPYPVKREADSLHYTYLDTEGRPVITVKNVGPMTEKLIQNFQLEFQFSRTSMLREPMLLILAYFTFFVLTIIYVRLDFAIVKDENTENKLKVSGHCEKLVAYQERRVSLYGAFDDAVVKLKTSKDVDAFLNTLKKISTELKNEYTTIGNVAAFLKPLSADAFEKVSELQRIDKIYREQQANQASLVEKLITGKLGKQQFINQEVILVRKKEECAEKMNAITAQLRSL